jgi:hypothetical protein
MKATKKTIDVALKENGLEAEIFKGNGYFYFVGTSVNLASEQGVYGVARFADLSVDRWVEECKALVQA